MMDTKRRTFSLGLSGFSIDFDVKIDSSIRESKSFGLPADTEFVFAVADTWLRIGGSRHLLISEFHTGNLVELLRTLEQRISAIQQSSGVEGLIDRCGWGSWMHGYWRRLNSDSGTTDDDATYDKLIPLSLLEGHEGHIAAYKFGDASVIEVATRPQTGEPVFACSDFEPNELVGELERMRTLVGEVLRVSKG